MIDELGHALAAICRDRSVLARIGGALGSAARAGLSLDQPRRARALALARSPVPTGLRGVDPTWIEAALAELPPGARTALANGPESEGDVWLVRKACSSLTPLPAIEPAVTRPRNPGDVLRMSASALRAWLDQVGEDQLAHALGEHADALGRSLVPAVLRISRAPRAGHLGSRRAAIERARGEHFVVGIRALAPHLEPVVARSLVLRFPYPEGRTLLREITEHAAAPTATWSAIVAL